jgi:hypothetical protein
VQGVVEVAKRQALDGLERLARVCAHVRQEQGAVVDKPRVDIRLVLVDVEADAGDVAGAQGDDERGLVDDAAAARVDDDDARPALGQRARVDDVVRRGLRVSRVDADGRNVR